MGEFLPAVGAFEGFLSAVYSEVLLEVMLELEGFIAIVALELAQLRALVVADHVPLQPIHVREALVAYLACLLTKQTVCSFNCNKQTNLKNQDWHL